MLQLSLIDFLERYGEANPPDMAWREGEDLAEWQIRFRAKLAELGGPVPERVEPTVEELEVAEEEDHTRTTLRISVNAFADLVAYLLIPKGLKPGEKRPGVLALHGHGARGIDGLCDAPGDEPPARPGYAHSAVSAGYVVMSPAWWGWTGRDGHLERVGGRSKCDTIQMAAAMYGLQVWALHVQDAQAALDAFVERPEVDAERIACLGNSYGGRTTMWTTIFDDRIRACIPSGCMNTFRERSLKLSSCGLQFPFGILRHGDVDDAFCLIAPRPMQLQAGEQDGLLTPADVDAMAAKVARAYAAAGAPDNFDFAHHEEGHVFRWDLAEPFLRKALGE